MKKENKSVIALVEGQGLRKSGPVMGLDVHKDIIQYCIVTEKKILKEGELENKKKGLTQLKHVIENRKVKSVAMESTSQYHVKVLYFLLEGTVHVLVANPLQTKQTQGKKTDKLDARRIAIAHRDGRLNPSVIPHYEYWMLRKAMRKLSQLTNEITKSKQRLAQFFHQKDFSNKKLLRSPRGVEILSLACNGTISEDKINAITGSSARKRLKLSKKGIIALQLFQKSLKPMEKITFRAELTQLKINELLREQQRSVYVEFAKSNEQFRNNMAFLLSIPGVGPDTAAIVLSEIADISYFKSPASLAKWAGLAPRVYQSGHKKHVTGKIHKGGNKYLRRAVVLSAQNIYAKTTSNPLHEWMRNKKKIKDVQANRSTYWLTLCAGARKLLTFIFHVLKNQCYWRFLEVSDEIIAKAKKHVIKKIKKFRREVMKYVYVKNKLSNNVKKMIGGISLPELSSQYVLYHLLNKCTIRDNE